MTQQHLQPKAERRLARRPEDWPRSPGRVKDWELVELAAEGPLAQTYRARPADASAERPGGYALKLLRPQWQTEPRAVELFRREALVGRTVHHPHLVSVLAAGVKEPPYYVVAPWLPGSTLAARLATGGPPDVPLALWTVRQVAEALEALNAAGWRHGDVKPDNIFLSSEGHVTLLDLGFARRADETGSVVERCLTGTCNYLAPETITSSLRADVRSDIYSLGVVLFEILSGTLPFEAADLAELATLHRQARAPDLRRLAPWVPTDVVRLIRAMLAKQPLRRPQTPRELIDRLAALEIATFSERPWG